MPSTNDDAPFEFAGCSHQGRVRAANEDSWITVVFDEYPKTALIAVADGMGGHGRGGDASRTAITAIRQACGGMIGLPQSQPLREILVSAFAHANACVYAMDISADGTRPGTTMTSVLVQPGAFVVAHSGDTRAYAISLARVVQITEDQSWISEQVRLGLIGPDDARLSVHRNRLLAALGTQPQTQPLLYEGTLEHGDVLLICSDGLWESVEAVEIAETIRNAASIDVSVRTLVQLALDRSGDDNITAVGLRHGGPVVWSEGESARRRARAPTPVPGTVFIPRTGDI